MKTLSNTFAALAIVALTAAGTAGAAMASEKTHGRDDTPSAIASVQSVNVAKGQENSRPGHYGQTVKAERAQLAEVPSHGDLRPKGGNR